MNGPAIDIAEVNTPGDLAEDETFVQGEKP